MAILTRSIISSLILMLALVIPAFGADSNWGALMGELSAKFTNIPGSTTKERMDSAIPIAKKALDAAVETYGSNSTQTAHTLCRFGTIYYVTGDYKSALRYYEPAYAILLTVPLTDDTMEWVPNCYYDYLSSKLSTGDAQYVLNWYKHYPLPTSTTNTEQITEFDLKGLLLLSRTYLAVGQHKKSLQLQLDAYELYKKMGVADTYEALDLIDAISHNYGQLNDITSSIRVLSDKLIELKAIPQKDGLKIAILSCNLAERLHSAGYDKEARELNNNCIQFTEKEIGKNSSAYYQAVFTAGLIDIADSDFHDAYKNFHEARLGLTSLIGENSEWVASSRRGEGVALFGLKKYDESTDELEKSMQLERSLGIHVNVVTYGMLAANYSIKKQYQKAVDIASTAYAETKSIYGDSNIRTAFSMTALGNALISVGNKGIGIAYLKAAINQYQSSRAKVQSGGLLDVHTYSERFTGVYTILADELFEEGRYDEAQLVLDMLKQDEYFEYIRRDFQHDPRTSRVPLSKSEIAEIAQYNQLLTKASQLESERLTVQRRIISLGKDPKSDTEILKIDAQIKSSNNAIALFLKENLKSNLQSRPASNKAALAELSREAFENKSVLMKKLGTGTVLLQYFLSTEKLGIVLTSSEGTIFKSQKITPSEFNSLIFKFYGELRNPNSDPRKVGKVLHGLLLDPISADLKRLNTNTLLLWLDGSLRYIPFAALFDGKQYLIDQYNLPIYTSLTTRTSLTPSQPKWRVAGLGVTKEHEGHKALPSVKNELASIVQEGGGILPGKIFLDEQFTKERLKSAPSSGFNVLHVASHFSFSPGTEINSYLLLGDGSKLTLSDIRSKHYRFDSTDMLTLSACETGLGGGYDSQGKEIEGFGIIAQQQGAKTVLATLWKVEDKSTSILMSDMYSQKLKGKNKIEALRQAQMDLKNKPEYSHPYFWAPFILMGNWQ